jgi:two-component system, OmpR family, response regulator
VEVIRMRVLVVEDAARLREIVTRRLREEGYAADSAGLGEEALAMASAVSYDAVILDLRLPDVDGVEVCARLRAVGCWSPVLMLTARDGVEDRVAGLDAGADDYLAKPFEFPELFARLRAMTRRPAIERPAVLRVADLRLDPATREVTRGGVGIDLTAKEFALLEYLMRNRHAVLSRDQLIDAVWDGDHRGESNIIEVYVGRLRDKIDRPFGVRSLVTVRGVGYRIEEAAGVADLA